MSFQSRTTRAIMASERKARLKRSSGGFRCLEMEQLENRLAPTTSQLIGDFAGFADTGFRPPSASSAVGPAGLLSAVNEQITIMNKSGGVIASAPLGPYRFVIDNLLSIRFTRRFSTF